MLGPQRRRPLLCAAQLRGLIVDIADGQHGVKLKRMTDFVRAEAIDLGHGNEQVQVKVIQAGPPKDAPIEAKTQGDEFCLGKDCDLLKTQLATYQV